MKRIIHPKVGTTYTVQWRRPGRETDSPPETAATLRSARHMARHALASGARYATIYQPIETYRKGE